MRVQGAASPVFDRIRIELLINRLEEAMDLVAGQPRDGPNSADLNTAYGKIRAATTVLEGALGPAP